MSSRTLSTSFFAASSLEYRPTVSVMPNSAGTPTASGMTKTREAVDSRPLRRKSASSHWVAAGLVSGRSGRVPDHTLSMSAIGGMSTVPRKATELDVRGGMVRTTSKSSVQRPPLSRQTFSTDALSAVANAWMSGPEAPVRSWTSVLVTRPECARPTVKTFCGDRWDRRRRIWKSPNGRLTT
ncbi:MAG: hypothetical protein EON53_09050 [Actinomycetales bacterium]|nr:MAG: hypothetical protein EON53_09050 [Actinomycetales bacterium]